MMNILLHRVSDYKPVYCGRSDREEEGRGGRGGEVQ